ncbi:polysaccharide biosynthesis/export family protein [soil metagenome]
MKRVYYNGLSFKPTGFILAAILFFGTYLLSSCTPTKSSFYFKTLQKDTTLSGMVNKDLESKIVKGDNLGIIISSLSKEEDLLFNSVPGSAGSAFLVDQDGNILLHKLGTVKAAGYTRKEFSAVLQKSLIPYLKDPIVSVQYLNHKITVMGEVERPQVINMVDEQLSVIDAIVISGDVKQNARRDNILVIREEDNQKKVKILNLEDHSIFSSPWYYLQPNDIVYVVPDEAKRQRDERRSRFQTNFAIASAAISLLVIILDRILR